MWRACAAIFALTALAFSACAKQQEIAPPAVGQAQPTVCDANHLAGWCRVVCVAACIGDSGFGASEAQLWTRLPLAQGAEGPQSVVDALSASDGCALSDDGFFWYEPQTIEFPPLVARFVRCRGPSVEAYARAQPPLPNWSRPTRSTRTLLVAGSLQDDLSRAGSEEIWALARGSGIPLTWMLGNLPQLRRNRDLYQGGHVRFGDDLQIEPYDDLMVATKSSLPWFQLSATIDGGGHERFIDHDLRMGARGFWGIAWNSRGIDSIADAGAPWGTYCADRSSYKRPARSGCDFVGIEWTARDLTRAYFSGHEETYSTDPDDLIERAGLTPGAAGVYARAIVDAYAAAGSTHPLVLMAQQEAAGAGANPLGSWAVLSALYDEARRTGMHAVTMSDAVAATRAFGGRPRAVAFPYIPNLPNVYQGALGTPPLPYPATIDYMDREVAMTFIAGRTLPVRVFPYEFAANSQWDRPLPQLAPGEFATLALAAVSDGGITLRFAAPVAQRFGVALWTDPAKLGAPPGALIEAGKAGAIAVFDLPAGISDHVVRCAACRSPVFTLAQ